MWFYIGPDACLLLQDGEALAVFSEDEKQAWDQANQSIN